MPAPDPFLVNDVSKLLIASEIPEIAVALQRQTAFGIFQQEFVNVLPCGVPADHLIAEILRVDFTVKADVNFIVPSVHWHLLLS